MTNIAHVCQFRDCDKPAVIEMPVECKKFGKKWKGTVHACGNCHNRCYGELPELSYYSCGKMLMVEELWFNSDIGITADDILL